ncbi:hypothetical protein ENKNEFLB_02609 [Nocardioides aquaticus]|uniref:Uncharacterized protein n=1 Tax=Nocardioides aquaticus TaxID=160826 RepID=A0ABX8EI63_9ACTN|nr:hypothetical protein ENKNEFLB_02609 [Nocardioides aquaticus]
MGPGTSPTRDRVDQHRGVAALDREPPGPPLGPQAWRRHLPGPVVGQDPPGLGVLGQSSGDVDDEAGVRREHPGGGAEDRGEHRTRGDPDGDLGLVAPQLDHRVRRAGRVVRVRDRCSQHDHGQHPLVAARDLDDLATAGEDEVDERGHAVEERTQPAGVDGWVPDERHGDRPVAALQRPPPVQPLEQGRREQGVDGRTRPRRPGPGQPGPGQPRTHPGRPGRCGPGPPRTSGAVDRDRPGRCGLLGGVGQVQPRPHVHREQPTARPRDGGGHRAARHPQAYLEAERAPGYGDGLGRGGELLDPLGCVQRGPHRGPGRPVEQDRQAVAAEGDHVAAGLDDEVGDALEVAAQDLAEPFGAVAAPDRQTLGQRGEPGQVHGHRGRVLHQGGALDEEVVGEAPRRCQRCHVHACSSPPLDRRCRTPRVSPSTPR